jgi:hypothetical protein
VTGWGDQLMKWLNAVAWFYTPLPQIILLNNMLWFTWDTFAYWGDVNFDYMKPHMYDNWLTKLFLSNPFGMWAYYDVFTVQGYTNWLTDSIMLQIAPWLEIIKAFTRAGRNDWTY